MQARHLIQEKVENEVPNVLPRSILDALQLAEGFQVKGISLAAVGAAIEVVADRQNDAKQAGQHLRLLEALDHRQEVPERSVVGGVLLLVGLREAPDVDPLLVGWHVPDHPHEASIKRLAATKKTVLCHKL